MRYGDLIAAAEVRSRERDCAEHALVDGMRLMSRMAACDGSVKILARFETALDIWPSAAAAGREPALEASAFAGIGTGRCHEVSILIAFIGPVG